jgi:RHS repeat-associated protein
MTGTGTIAKDNPFRFSTKRTDDTTDLVLYEYRAYSPSMGRWPNRDPIEERGGANLYGFVGNNPVSSWDAFGLQVADDKHVVGKCDASLSCKENLALLLRFQLEIAIRFSGDFTDTFRQWAIQGKEIPPAERYNPKVTN